MNFYTVVSKVATLPLELLCTRMFIVDVLQLDYSPITRLPGVFTFSPFKKKLRKKIFLNLAFSIFGVGTLSQRYGSIYCSWNALSDCLIKDTTSFHYKPLKYGHASFTIFCQWSFLCPDSTWSLYWFLLSSHLGSSWSLHTLPPWFSQFSLTSFITVLFSFQAHICSSSSLGRVPASNCTCT